MNRQQLDFAFEIEEVRIGAAAKLNGLSYSQLIHGLKLAGVELDR